MDEFKIPPVPPLPTATPAPAPRPMVSTAAAAAAVRTPLTPFPRPHVPLPAATAAHRPFTAPRASTQLTTPISSLWNVSQAAAATRTASPTTPSGLDVFSQAYLQLLLSSRPLATASPATVLPSATSMVSAALASAARTTAASATASVPGVVPTLQTPPPKKRGRPRGSKSGPKSKVQQTLAPSGRSPSCSSSSSSSISPSQIRSTNPDSEPEPSDTEYSGSDPEPDDDEPDDEDDPGPMPPVPVPTSDWTDVELKVEPDLDVKTWSMPVSASHTVRNHGHNNLGLREYEPTAKSIFGKMLPDNILDEILLATNAYAAPRVYTRADIVAWMMAVFVMGIIQMPVLRMYWATATRCPAVTRLMSYTKFSAMCRDIHTVDTSAFDANTQSVKNKEDAFWKMGDIVEKLSNVWKKNRRPEPNLSVDECTVPFRGRHRARQFNPSKPDRYHLKAYSLNEACSGYCLGMFFYQGKDEKRPPGVPTTAYPFVRLIGENTTLHNKGYHVWADNWFTSVRAIDICRSYGVGYTGTVRANRMAKAFPRAKFTGKRGSFRVRGRELGTAEALYAFTWMDSKPVNMLSTVLGTAGTVTRRAKLKNSGYHRLAVPCPSIYGAYNLGMGGTDVMDQMVKAYYRNNRFKWPLKVLIHLMYVCMNNAHITYLEIVKKPKKELPLLKFIQMVVDEFKPPSQAPSSPPQAPEAPPSSVHTPMWAGKAPRRQGIEVMGGSSEVREYSKKEKDRKRGHCVVCHSYTPHYCMDCTQGKKTYLHIDTETGTTCWSEYHSN